jgi:LacI family transcriptional regulator
VDIDILYQAHTQKQLLHGGRKFKRLNVLCGIKGFRYSSGMNADPHAPRYPLAFFGFDRYDYFRRVAESATREAREHPGVRFRIFEHKPEDMFAHADLPEIRGVIAPFLKPEHLQWFQERRANVILFSSRMPASEIPDSVGWIRADDEAIGAAAAQHFDRMGMSHAAFFGVGSLQFARLRESGFRRTWEKIASPRGHYCSCLEGNSALVDFLTTLPRPCGICCSDDGHARSLITEALRLGFRIPEDFAVIGVDHDLLLSELSPIRLTSVIPDAETLGRLAVRALLRSFEENDHPGRCRELVPPLGIHYDESAPYYYSVEPSVSRALQWMEKNLSTPVIIEDLALYCGVSRRNLEYLFKKHLDHGPYQQLLQMRLHLAKRLLRHSTKNISDISDACGFTNAREFSVRFKGKTGQTPSQYREGE